MATSETRKGAIVEDDDPTNRKVTVRTRIKDALVLILAINAAFILVFGTGIWDFLVGRPGEIIKNAAFILVCLDVVCIYFFKHS